MRLVSGSADDAAGPGAADGVRRHLPKAELATTLALGGAATALADLQLGVFIWAVGLLLSLGEIRAAQQLEAQLAPVTKLAEIIDLSDRCDSGGLRQLVDAYVRVPEREFSGVKDEVVSAAREELARLRVEKSSVELATGAYYQWLLPMLDEMSKGEHVRAVSLMMSCEWDESPVERRFIEGNVWAAERGATIDRIFVMASAQLLEARTNPAILRHFTDQHPATLQGHFVDADHLTRADSRLNARLGDGFIAFGDRVALIDLHSADGSARGQVTMLVPRLAGLRQIFEELLVHSQPLTPGLVEAQHQSAGTAA